MTLGSLYCATLGGDSANTSKYLSRNTHHAELRRRVGTRARKATGEVSSFGVWTKRGVGHGLPYGLPYGPPYDLPVVSFVKARFSIATNLCKQRAPSVCHIYDSWRSYFRVWTKRGVGHGLPYGPPYGLPEINFLKLGSAVLLTCVNNMPHESVTLKTLFCPFGGVSVKFSIKTRGRLE